MKQLLNIKILRLLNGVSFTVYLQAAVFRLFECKTKRIKNVK
jgi:hypothetical protein